MAMVVMLQVVILLSSLVLIPGLSVAGSAPEQASTGSDLKIQLFPRTVAISAGGTAAVSAWTCDPDAAASPGKDGVPGTGDDGCKPANGAVFSVGDTSVAKLDDLAGNEAIISGVSAGQTRLVAELADLTARADVVVKAAPALKPKAEEPKKAAKQPKNDKTAEQPKKTEEKKADEPKKAEKLKNNKQADELQKAEAPRQPKAEEPRQPKKADEPKSDNKAEKKEADEPAADEPKKAEQPKAEEPKKAEQPKAEEPKAEEKKAEQPKKAEQSKAEEKKKAEEPEGKGNDEPRQPADDKKAEAPKAEDKKADEPAKTEEPKGEGNDKPKQLQTEEQESEQSKKADEPEGKGNDEPKQPKAEEAKAEEPAAEEPAAERPKGNDMPKNDNPKKDNAKGDQTLESAVTAEPVVGEPAAEPTEPPAEPTAQAELADFPAVTSGATISPAASNFSVTPAVQSVAAGSTNDFVWTFAALNAANELTTTFTINAAWTAPSSSAGSGQVIVTPGTCDASLASVVGYVVTIDQGPGSGRCRNGQTFTLGYLQAVAPAAGTYTFANQHGVDTQIIVTGATGTIVVEKQAVGGDDGFDFTSATLGDFSLTTSGGSDQTSFTDLAPGTYDVAETVPDGWDLTSATCDDGSDPDTIDLASGETVTCTFTNAKRGSITVEKVANGGDGTFDFTGDLGDFSLTTVSGIASRTFGDLLPDTYAISETVPDGWNLTSAICTGGQFPSAVDLAPGANIKCGFLNTRIPTGTIVVEKQAVGGDDGFDFTSATLGDFSLTTSGGSDQTSFTDLAPGTYDVAETVPDGWDLTSATCDDGSDPDTIDLASGETVTCTFTNAKRGSITVEKVANGGDGTFDFTGDLGDFSLTTVSGIASRTFGDLLPDTYAISETVPDGWNLTSAICTGGQFPSAVDLAPGANIKCGFLNTRIPTGTIVVEKQAVGGDDGFDFTSATLGDFSLTTSGGSDQTSFTDLAPGTYDVAETVPDGWDLTSATCDDGSDPDTIDLASGETVTCTFTNAKRGSITVEKVANGGDGTFDFTGDLGDFSLTTVSGIASRTFGDLLPDTYAISETVPDGWNLTSAICTGGQFPSAVDLAPGANIKCGFLNTRIPTGTIVVEKQAVGGDDGFDFTSATLGDFSLTTSGGSDQTSFTDLAPGTYDVAETVPDGWDLTSATCDDGSDPDTIDLASGETVTCTFTNAKRGSITVEKVANGGDGTFDFTGDLGDFSLTTVSGIASRTFGDLLPDTYAISETVPDGWNLTSAICTGGQFPSAVDLAPGANIKCGFLNTRIPTGTIVVEKQAVGGDDGFDFTSATLGDFSLTTSGGSDQTSFTDLAPGTYDVAETVPDGWDLTSATCDDGSDPDTIDLASGETVTCTFTNAKRGSITVEKVANGGDGTFDFTGDLGDFSLTTVSGIASRTFGDLLPDTYAISETVPDGWNLTSAIVSPAVSFASAVDLRARGQHQVRLPQHAASPPAPSSSRSRPSVATTASTSPARRSVTSA